MVKNVIIREIRVRGVPSATEGGTPLMTEFSKGQFVSEPRKHHYVPVCYLKQWASTDDRRLCEHKLIPGGYGVKPRRTSPDGTGYQIDLYRIDGVPDDIAQDFEKRFMHLVDTDASRALERIIAGTTDDWPGSTSRSSHLPQRLAPFAVCLRRQRCWDVNLRGDLPKTRIISSVGCEVVRLCMSRAATASI
jgi:hypothetical protein